MVPRATAFAEFGEVTGPLVRTDEYLVPTGLDPDLGEAMRRCVRSAISLIRARWGLDEHLAYAYLSAATDFDISQVVDIVCGVHARIRESDFAAVPLNRLPLNSPPRPGHPPAPDPLKTGNPVETAQISPDSPVAGESPVPGEGRTA